MRLHRLTLHNVRGVRERTVDLPASGVVVLEGPNEVGKTTMLEAFDALLTYKATSRAAEVRSLQPLDRDEAPFVEAELTVGGTRVRYGKRWLRQPATTLHVLGARPEQLTGDRAQQRADGLLGAHLDRTLYDALRLSQSGDATVAPLASSRVLTQALDAAAGARLHSDGAEAILDDVEAEYRLYFTATGRPTGEYREAMTRHVQAQQDVAEAHRRVEEVRDLLQRQEAARARAATTQRELASATDQLARAEEAAADVEAVAAASEAAATRLAGEQELHRAAERSLALRRRLSSERETLATALHEARAERQAAEGGAERLAAALLDAEESAAGAADAEQVASDDVESARADCDHLADVRDLASSEALLARATELVERVCSAEAAQPARAVTRDAARRVLALQDRLDATVAQHAAATPSLEIESLGAPVEVRLSGDDGRGVAVPARDSVRVGVAHDTTIEVPGQLRVRVLLHEEARGRAAEIDRLREQLRSTLEELGAGDVEEVDALADATEQARESLREARRDLESLLRPLGAAVASEAARGAVPASLQDRVVRVRNRVDANLAVRAGDRPLPADEDGARTAVAAASARLAAARAAHREAARHLGARREEVARLTRRLDQVDHRIASNAARLAALDEELAVLREECSDTDLAQRVTARTAKVTAAREAAQAAARAVLAADVEGVRAALRSARHETQLAAAAREKALAELNVLGGQVELVAGEGRQELYDLAVSDLDDAERELRAVDRRARAARHLRTTLADHRDAAHRLYVRPYTEAIQELGRRVYGPGFAITVAEDLSLAARTLDGVTVPYDGLSGGAKEQLGILARLAVARLVDRVHGVPVVIDDALGYTDPLRLRQMGEVLGAGDGNGPDVQVILLTCTPERYAAIPHATTVRLTA